MSLFGALWARALPRRAVVLLALLLPPHLSVARSHSPSPPQSQPQFQPPSLGSVDEEAQGAPATPPAGLLAVTWNLRYAANDAYPWRAERLGLTAELWRAQDPDLVGTQEGLYGQLQDLARELPAWAWIGLGREGGSRGEHCAIFYRRERFEPREFDHFWLSDTPDTVGSRSFGNRVVRMATWARLLDRGTGRELVVLNTHLDHQSPTARLRGAELVARRLARFPAELPLIVLGDFNAPGPGSEPYALLLERGSLSDSWLAAPARDPDLATFHDYRGPSPGPRIDWVLHRGPLAPLEARIWTFERGGRYPSDHFPVAVRFALLDD
jgi:endonuclease/exonuclease/phosphatase family metal-dependent hydrolase